MVHRSGRISFQQANRRNSEPIRALHSGTIFGNFVGCRCYITHPHKYTDAINIFHLHSAQLHSGQRGFPKEKTDDLIQRLRVHSYSHILTCTHKLSFAFTYARITRRWFVSRTLKDWAHLTSRNSVVSAFNCGCVFVCVCVRTS